MTKKKVLFIGVVIILTSAMVYSWKKHQPLDISIKNMVANVYEDIVAKTQDGYKERPSRTENSLLNPKRQIYMMLNITRNILLQAVTMMNYPLYPNPQISNRIRG